MEIATQHHIVAGQLNAGIEEIRHQFVVLMCVERRGSTHRQTLTKFVLQCGFARQENRLQEF